MNIFKRSKPAPPAMLVRVQHRDLDDAAIEGVWVGMYDSHYHIRAAKTVLAGERKPIPTGEILVPVDKIVFLEVLGVDRSSAGA